MMNLDLDPIDEVVQRWPQGTAFLFLAHRVHLLPSVRDYISEASSKDYVDWAVNALLEGFEAPSLNILAGLDFGEAGSKCDAVKYFDSCIRELKLELPDDAPILLRAHLFELVSQIASGEADPCETLDRIHRYIVNPLNHSQDLMPWCFLWESNTPDGHYGQYSDEEHREVVVAYAHSWTKNGPDVLLPWLGEHEDLEVTCSPNPVKAQRGGSNGQRYEWVFETKVRAIDKPVRILDFGTFSRQCGRWVFSTPTGTPFSAKDFADQYSCPGAILRPGESFSTLNTVSSRDLRDWKASWYFRGVMPPHGGVVVKGTAVVEGLTVLEAKSDVPSPSQPLEHGEDTPAAPASSPPDVTSPGARSTVPVPGAAPRYEDHEDVPEDIVAAPVRADDLGAVEPLVTAIEESDANVRLAGIAALVQVGEPAVEPLLGALKDSRPGVRRSAVVALGQIGDARAVKSLLMALKDSNENVRRAAAAALGQIGDARALEPLLAALKDSDEYMRNAAAAALWQIGDARADELLLTVLKDRDPQVRLKAVLALAQTADTRAVEAFGIALQDSDEFVRMVVATTLGNLRDARGVEPLVAALGDSSRFVRERAATALGQIGDPGAVPPLVKALYDSERDVRRVAAVSLGWIGDSRAVEPLVTVLKHDRFPRAAAASALGMIGDSRAVEPLMTALRDSDRLVRSRAAESLGKIGDKRALMRLMALQRDDVPAVRGAAVRALGHLGDARAVEPLITALQDSHWPVRKNAAEALGQMGDARAVTSLVALQHDAISSVRGAAVRALGHLGDVRVVDLLLTALRDNDWSVRDAGVAALVQMGEPAVAPLVMALNDSEHDIRRRAAVALGQIGNDRAAAPLVMALKDGDEKVRKAAASALGNIGQPAVEPLRLALRDSDGSVHETAVAVLVKLGFPEDDTSAPPEPGPTTSAPSMSWDAPAWNGEAQRLANLGQWQEAIACYEKALALAPHDACAWLGKGRCLAALGSLEEAIDCYGQAVAIDPQLEAAWFRKALAEERLGHTRDAVHSYERYIAVAPAQDETQIEYARQRLRELGDGGEGRADPQVPPEPSPPDPKPRHPQQAAAVAVEELRARSHHREGVIGGFRKFLARVLDRKDKAREPASPKSDLRDLVAKPTPQDAVGWQGEARQLAALGHWEGAIPCLDKAIALDPQSPTAWYDKARCLAALGRLEEAIKCYSQSLTLDPQMAAAWFGKALAEEKLGRMQDAIQSYEQYIAVGLDQDAKQIEYARHCIRDLRSDGTEPPVPTGSVRSAPPPRHLPQDLSADDEVKQREDRITEEPSAHSDRQGTDQIKDAWQRRPELTHSSKTGTEPSQPSEPAPSPPKPRRPRRAPAVATAGYQEGDHIGEFEVHGVLGQGGFGVVYLVHLPTYVDIASLETFRDEDLPSRGQRSDRYVIYALKTLLDPYLAVPEVRQRFRQEAQMLVDLERHPHLLQADFVDEIAGRLYIATEYVAPNAEGLNSLEGYLQQQPPGLAQSLRWAIQACYGMEYAYSRGLRCHRDLKPANILITRDRAVKIADFGLAGVLEEIRPVDGIQVHTEDGRIGLSAQTMEGAGFGTPTHMPPEQFTGAASCDERSDLYAFGVVLYQMASGGKLPFLAAPPRDGSLAERRRFWAEMHQLHETASVRQLDTPLFPIIERCLAKEPAQRYRSFRELRVALEPLLRQETGEVIQAPVAGQLTAGEWHIKGYSLAAMGRMEEALECFDRSLELEPQHATPWTNKGMCLNALGRREEAMACHDRALTLNPLYAEAWCSKGSTLSSLARYQEAIVCFDRALALDSQSVEAWTNKGLCLDELGRSAEAIFCVDRALDLAPQNALVWNSKGSILSDSGGVKEAIACFDQALALNPRLAEAWSRKAESLAYLGQHKEAIACCDRALELNPQHVVAWGNKGAILAALGRREEAIVCYDRVLALDPQNAIAWNNKANNLGALGRLAEAITCYEQALALDPKYAHAWFNRALSEDRVGRRRDAVRSYERFLAVASPQDLMQIEHARRRLRDLGRQ